MKTGRNNIDKTFEVVCLRIEATVADFHGVGTAPVEKD